MQKNIRKIESIIDDRGIVYSTKDATNIFKPISEEFHKARMENEFRCNLCGMPIMFSSNKNMVYVKHKPTGKESKCPWHSQVVLTKEEADALKYNGAKEGEKHILYKEFLFNFFKDSEEFTNEALETRRTIEVENMIRWRQPDVFATYKKVINIAFEVQLQTILMTHILERRKFYKKDDTFMMWIFEDRDIKDYRFSDGDIFFTNNQNGFFLNNEVMELSRQTNNLMIGVKYRDFILDENNEIDFKSISKIIPFDKIIFNQDTREVYYFDSRAKKRELEKEAFLNTPISIGEEFKYKGINFKILRAKSLAFYIHYQNENGLFLAGNYHSFHKTIQDAKRHILSIVNKT